MVRDGVAAAPHDLLHCCTVCFNVKQAAQASIVRAEAFAVATLSFVLLLQWLTSFIEKRLAKHKHAEDMLR